MTTSSEIPGGDDELLARAVTGDQIAVGRLLGHYRERLKRMVMCRMDDRLVARIDPSDVVQEAMIVAARSLTDYSRKPPLPFYLWLRQITRQRLIDLHRRHLASERRSVLREESMPGWPESSMHQLVQTLVSDGTNPSQAAEKAEVARQVRSALEQLEPTQRELLLLHYIEGLSLAEAGEVLQITADASRMRHFRALKHLRSLLDDTF